MIARPRLALFVCASIFAVSSATAAEPQTVALVIRGQTAGQADGAMLLFGEVARRDGKLVGSYFERFTPTKVDAKTRAPLAGKGRGLFRLPGGTLATQYSSKVTGPGTRPKSIRVESSGRIVQGTGDYAGMTGRFTSVGIVSPAMSFETTVNFRVTGGQPLPVPPLRHAFPAGLCGCRAPSHVVRADYLCPARCVPHCCVPQCCPPRSLGLRSVFRCCGD